MTFIKSFILKWLGVDAEIKNLELSFSLLKSELISARSVIDIHAQRIRHFDSLIDVGVDVHMHSPHSWAVICISGKTEYVRFVDLGHKEIYEISKFIKRFEGNNVCIDTPHRMPKEMFKRF